MPEADETDPGAESSENANIRLLREKAAKADEATAAHAALQREVAFLKAGIDTDSKLGKLLFKSYEGDLTDIEALKTEATEIGAIQAAAPAEQASAEQSSAEDHEPTGSTQRQELAAGAPADTGEKLHPWKSAQEVFDRSMSDGETWEHSAGMALNALANAAQSGDVRATVPGR